MMNKLVEIKNLNVGYNNTDRVLRDLDLNIYQNDFLGLIGPNGGGKTTLLKIILGLISPITGSIQFYKNNAQIEKLNIGYLPQINQIDKKFPISVFDVILSGLTADRKIFKYYSEKQKVAAKEMVSLMGLDKLLDKPIGNLSGGQLQRTLLGRAIIDNPDLLILDEPNSYIDKRFEKDFYKILEQINKERAIVMVSHDTTAIVSQVKNIAYINKTLYYHQGSDISTQWVDDIYLKSESLYLGK